MNKLCPKCNKPMENLGNIDNKFVYLTNPPKWQDTWVCDVCKIKTKEWNQEQEKVYRFLEGYAEYES